MEQEQIIIITVFSAVFISCYLYSLSFIFTNIPWAKHSLKFMLVNILMLLCFSVSIVIIVAVNKYFNVSIEKVTKSNYENNT
jgi:hypothetical protein